MADGWAAAETVRVDLDVSTAIRWSPAPRPNAAPPNPGATRRGLRPWRAVPRAAEEVFDALTDTEEGLGALEPTPRLAGVLQPGSTSPSPRHCGCSSSKPKEACSPRAGRLPVGARHGAGQQRPFRRRHRRCHAAQGRLPIAEVFFEVDQNATTRLVVLDPRQWTLLNGRDTPTRGDIAALLGVGDHPLPVDNAASCVVACINAQRRDAVRKRAAEALAWRAVLAQLEPSDDKYDEAQAEYNAAAQRVDADLLKAYQHYAYLIRTDRVEVDWQRFDDDSKSGLKGGHVWDALARNDRATYPANCPRPALRTLLERTPRALTLKEVTQQFYKNPAYPMVASIDDIRRAVYGLLTGAERYEIVDASGEALTITSADELSIGSMDQLLRKAAVAPAADTSPAVTMARRAPARRSPPRGPPATIVATRLRFQTEVSSTPTPAARWRTCSKPSLTPLTPTSAATFSSSTFTSTSPPTRPQSRRSATAPPPPAAGGVKRNSTFDTRSPWSADVVRARAHSVVISRFPSRSSQPTEIHDLGLRLADARSAWIVFCGAG